MSIVAVRTLTTGSAGFGGGALKNEHAPSVSAAQSARRARKDLAIENR
jgi:hypothetical protein